MNSDLRRSWLIAVVVVLVITTASWMTVQFLWTHPVYADARVRLAGWFMIAAAFPWSYLAMSAFWNLPRPLGSALYHFAVVVGLSANWLSLSIAAKALTARLWPEAAPDHRPR